MHTTAYDTGRLFFQTYAQPHHVTCLDVGSYDVNGSLRSLAPPHMKYVGVDMAAGPGVDIVLQDPHKLPFVDNWFDLIVSSSCFEHDSMFWLTFLECVRVLKPQGVLYISAPSNGTFHAYPKDNWRFYPDSGQALVSWAHKQGVSAFLVESFLTLQRAEGQWNDCVMIFSKGDPGQFPSQKFVSDVHDEAYNIRNMRTSDIINYQPHTQDHLIQARLSTELNQLRSVTNVRPAPVTNLNKFSCTVCGNNTTHSYNVIWPELIEQWQLTPAQVAYVNQQQGTHCAQCHNNLRSLALAGAITCTQPHMRLPDWINAHSHLKVLEINTAGTIHPWIKHMPQHVLAEYPEVDMQHMPYADDTWDMVVHSDTLEHVRDPVQALKECHRVLVPGGRVCFTVPVIVERLSRNRKGMPLSHHGSQNTQDVGLQVHTEFGADVWRSCVEAGFEKVTLHTLCYPAAMAIEAVK